MARRHDSLIPLSHDHHHALHEVRMLRKAAGADEAVRADAARAFVGFFRKDSLIHFREEEEEIFPLVVDLPGAPLDGIARLLLDHIRIHALVKELERSASPETMRRLADLLKDHIRFEENEVFPAIEALVPHELERVQLAERAHWERRERRDL